MDIFDDMLNYLNAVKELHNTILDLHLKNLIITYGTKEPNTLDIELSNVIKDFLNQYYFNTSLRRDFLIKMIEYMFNNKLQDIDEYQDILKKSHSIRYKYCGTCSINTKYSIDQLRNIANNKNIIQVHKAYNFVNIDNVNKYIEELNEIKEEWEILLLNKENSIKTIKTIQQLLKSGNKEEAKKLIDTL